MTTPDLGAGMTDFSYTHQHIADGRKAAEQLLEQISETEQVQVEHSVAAAQPSVSWGPQTA